MTEIYKFFNSAPGDERWHYASDFADYFGKVLSTGLLHKDGSPNLQVKVKAGTLQTYVEPGEALMQGYQYQNTQDLYLTHNIPESNLDRIDRIVLRLDKRNSSRYIKLFVKEGVSAVNPVAPALQRDNYIHEISLAQIRLTKNTATLNPLFLVDERMQESLCGIVYSLISVPTSVFQQQWDSWFNIGKYSFAEELNKWMDDEKASFTLWQEGQKSDFIAWRDGEEALYQSWIQGRKANFDEWFATIRGILDEEAAGNIMNVINDLKDSPVPHKYYDEGLAQPMLYGLKRNAELNTPAFVYGATEAGPLSTINLPSYEQVEGVKTALKVEMENTGGKIVDIYNKKYKAVMSELGEFKDHFGVDEGAKLDDDFKAKYPTMAAKYKLMGGYVRTHLWNNIHFIQIGLDVIFVDMKNLTVISAHTVSHINYAYSVNTPTNYFVDSKYIYIRGRPNTNNSLSFAVFEKNTFEFVTAIRLAAAISGFTDQVIVGEMVLQGNKLFATCASFNNQIYCFNLSYDGNGVPTGLSLASGGTFGSGSSNPPKIFYGDSEFLYVGYINGGLTIEKRKYNPVTFMYDLIASNTSSTNGFSTNPTWIYKYKVEGVKYMIVHGTSGSTINVINMDTMSLHYQIFSGQLDQCPTFDYDKGDKLYVQPQNAVFVDINGQVFEQYCELTLVGNLWYPKWNFTPVLKRYNSDASIALSRIFMLGSRGFVKDGVLCAYKFSPIPGGLTGHFKYDNMSVLSHYKEVIE